MEIKIIEREKISVIGKMGQGAVGNSFEWIQDLWDEANEHFNEIGSLAKVNNDGSFAGFWGAMSNTDETFLPWDWQGKYLASCEVKDDAEAPEGWTKWIIPAFKYIVAKCNHETYDEVLQYITNDYMPNHKYRLVGAIQEYYDPKILDGSFYLYFPIEAL